MLPVTRSPKKLTWAHPAGTTSHLWGDTLTVAALGKSCQFDRMSQVLLPSPCWRHHTFSLRTGTAVRSVSFLFVFFRRGALFILPLLSQTGFQGNELLLL